MRKVPISRVKFYVYDIIDPRTDHVFYVGCGSGNRIKTTVNPKLDISHSKATKLESIARAGLKPVVKIVMCFPTRQEALTFERERQIRFNLVPKLGRRRPIDYCDQGLTSWCSHPKYDRVCRFLPRYCSPQFRG